MARIAILGLLTIIIGCNNTTENKDNKMFNIFKGKTKPKEILSHTDYNRFFENNEVDGVPIELLDIGKLNMTTGQIVVCDPLVFPDTPPLNKTVPPGNYPIKIYVAKTKESGDRYAIAKLEISSKRADKWVLAIREGEDISSIKEEGEFLGFAVDAGLGGFYDFKAGLEYLKFEKEFMTKNPNGNIYDDFFAAEFKKNAIEPNNPNDIGNWLNFTIPNSDLNITMFHSGYGDGTYPVFYGMTNNNEIVSVVIDFFVLGLPDGK